MLFRSDIADVARGNIGPVFGIPAKDLRKAAPVAPEAHSSAYYLRFQVLDVPGVMAEITRQLANEGISIESMLQRGRSPGEQGAIWLPLCPELLDQPCRLPWRARSRRNHPRRRGGHDVRRRLALHDPPFNRLYCMVVPVLTG